MGSNVCMIQTTHFFLPGLHVQTKVTEAEDVLTSDKCDTSIQRLLGRPRHRSEDNIKLDHMEMESTWNGMK